MTSPALPPVSSQNSARVPLRKRPATKVILAGFSALLIGASVLATQGMWAFAGSSAQLAATQGLANAHLIAAFQHCQTDADNALKLSNRDGYLLSRGEAVAGKSISDPSLLVFLRDRSRMSASCLLSAQTLEQPSQMSNMLLAGLILSARDAQDRLPPEAAATSQKEQEAIQIAALRRQTDLAFRRDTEQNLAWLSQFDAICGGLGGKLRCLPAALGAAAPGARRAALHRPAIALSQQPSSEYLAASVDRQIWRLDHPAEHSAEQARVFAARAKASKESLEAALSADPTPSVDAMQSRRAQQAAAIKSNLDRSLKDAFAMID